MANPDQMIPKFKKLIGLNNPNQDGHMPGGWLFAIKDEHFRMCGSARSYIKLLEPSVLCYGFRPDIPIIAVFLQTESPVECFNFGVPPEMETKIYINKDRLLGNQQKRYSGIHDQDVPMVMVEERGAQQFGLGVEIDGPCIVGFYPNTPHEFGGRIWIETNAPVKVLQEERGY